MKNAGKTRPNRRLSRRSTAALQSDPLLSLLFVHSGSSRSCFRGQSVLVTGGASGIGRAIAVGFALAGAEVTILDIDRKRGRAALAELRSINRECRFLHADLRDKEDVTRAAEFFSGASGATILVNNAADVGRIAPFVDLEQDEFEAVIRSNMLGPALLSRLAARHLIASGRNGSIINVLTIQTITPVPGYSSYVTSKGGLEVLTLAMAVDLAPHGIRVNGIGVGSVVTDKFLEVLPDRLKKQMVGKSRKDVLGVLDRNAATLIGRMGRPSEVAKIALFLASDDASYLTGCILRADGGRLLSRRVDPLL